MASLSSSVAPGVSKRADFRIDLSRTAILVVDVQDHLSSAESENLASEVKAQNHHLYNVSLPKAIDNISRLVDAARLYRDDTATGLGTGCEVIFTFLESLTNDCRDVSLDYKLSGPKLSHLPGPSNRAKFLSKLEPSSSNGRGDILIPKTSCSVFNSTNIAYVLRNLHVEQIIVVGQLTDQCVESAVRDAADLGFFVTVVEDACAATGTAEHAMGLAGMKGFSRILKTDEVLAEMQADAASRFGLNTKDTLGRNDQIDAQSETTEVQSQLISNINPKRTMIAPPERFDVDNESESKATTAVLRSLRAAGVEFLRYLTLDATNSIRCKAIPLQSIRPNADGYLSLDKRASIAEVCFVMPTHADAVVPSCGLSAAGVLLLRPDLGSLRVLPYAKSSAVVFGTAHNQLSGSLSPLCTRGLLERVIASARDQFGLKFNCGVEIEFTLFKDGKIGEFVDASRFAEPATLNEQQDFISDLVQQLADQDIEVEMIHSESGPGQVEVVLKYRRDLLEIADNVVLTRETIRACARSHNMRALFLPKVEKAKAGNGQHIHFSFCGVDGHSAFCLGGTGLSHRAEAFMEGILYRLPALLAITTPSVNSFRRMGAGCWTGHDVRWAVEDKEVALRVCLDHNARSPSNVEFKLLDGNANIYLSLAAIICSGLEGIAKNLLLRPENGPAAGESKNKALPLTFQESLDLLEADNFLCNTVLGSKFSTAYIAVRRAEAERSSKMTLADEVEEAFAGA